MITILWTNERMLSPTETATLEATIPKDCLILEIVAFDQGTHIGEIYLPSPGSRFLFRSPEFVPYHILERRAFHEPIQAGMLICVSVQSQRMHPMRARIGFLLGAKPRTGLAPIDPGLDV